MTKQFEELLENLLKDETFQYTFAEAIAHQYTDKLDDFTDQVSVDMEKHVKKIIQGYINTWEVEKQIKKVVEQAFQDITKKELLSLLMGAKGVKL